MFTERLKQNKFFEGMKETECLQFESKEQIQLTQVELEQAWGNLNFADGSIVIVMLPNSISFIRHVFALIKNGYVPALLSPSTPVARLNLLAQQFKAKAIVKHKFVNSGECLESLDSVIKLQHYEVAILNNTSTSASTPGEIIITTSGTTGINTGCVFDFDTLLKNAEKHVDAICMTERDITLVSLPLYYSYAFVAQALACYLTGAQLVISGPPFNRKQYLQELLLNQISVSSLTPILIKDLITNGVEFPRTLRTLTIGGDQIDPKQVVALLKTNKHLEVYLTYGITQAGPRVATLSAHTALPEKLGSVGKLLPGTELSIETTNDGINGELLIHSDTLAKRCLGDSKRQIFIERDNKKWLKTGDIFSLDSDGYLYFKHRGHDFVIIGGEKINLSAIKSFILSKFKVLSIKTALIKEDEQLIGYYLDILVGKNFKKTLEDIQQFINSTFRMIERPKFIKFAKLNKLNMERYK